MNRHARIGRRTVVAQPIVSTISVGLQGNYGMSHGMPPPVVAAPMPQMPSQWNPAPTESQPPPYSYSHPI
ncbi:unnamed protein product [Orchesella dallaii]|uniref:Uncharacterized protein n=1 Tax=Orchesella dallaii TaxID=48710 RepID=A0ABP1S845_9HEXA